MSSLSRLFAALVTVSLLGAACASKGGATAGGSSTVEEVPTEGATTEAKPQVQLQKLSPPENFSVMIPGEPQPQRGEVAIPGGKVQTAAWTANVEGVLYSISTADYPERVVAANPAAAFLNEGKNGLVNQLKGTVKA
ncbi:MAG TPA: hypothetical protein VF794_05490, partial [Archangium sp.]